MDYQSSAFWLADSTLAAGFAWAAMVALLGVAIERLLRR